ncbi:MULTISPECIES: AIPR family protein [Lactococcus]|uniref:AIPR family protein n=2 Tax=Streptococcaceae TaxID=1300 RepID=UPI0013FE4557|nr:MULTISPECIES: AIPR family protein [Lactococcus]MCO7130279.1 AIPR family protein [Lactococcus garvieae]NHI66247.1 hypothetical protein [Lactococcus petauri]QSQ99353.1 AIPR family protein [Lactococcus garvieae]
MAKNDKILIDGMIDELCETSNVDSKNSHIRGEIFEKFSVAELLKNYDITESDLNNGIVDGSNDGGIDGFYVFLNSRLIKKVEDILIFEGAIIDVYIIQCKHDDSFKLAPLDAIFSSLVELFDLTISKDNFCSQYNEKVIQKRELLKTLYKKLALKNPKLNIKVCYISRGDVKELGQNISAKATQIESMVTNSFSGSNCKFLFIGSEELIEMNRKKRNGQVSLKVKKSVRYGKHHVIVVSLLDYYQFLITDDGQLKRYYFDENVRDYLGSTRTNNDIFETLITEDRPDFWLMNNGITIISDNATEIDEEIVMNNVQIVNGLQTSNTIYNYFSSLDEIPTEDKRSILIKVIMKQDDNMKNLIIQSTNNQTQIGLSSLMAVDKIQKDIEQHMLEKGYYYERRTNEHKNAGIDAKDIFSPLELAAIHVALYLKQPYQATRLKQKYFKSEKNYNLIYNSNNSLELWPKYAMMVKTIKTYLVEDNSKKRGQKYQKRIIPLTAFFYISVKSGRYNFSNSDIIKIETLDDELLIKEIFTELNKRPDYMVEKNNGQRPRNGTYKDTDRGINSLIEKFSNKYDIKNKEVILSNDNKKISLSSKK